MRQGRWPGEIERALGFILGIDFISLVLVRRAGIFGLDIPGSQVVQVDHLIINTIHNLSPIILFSVLKLIKTINDLLV